MRQNPKDNYIIIDWLSFTSKIHTVPEVVELLGLSSVKFEICKGFYGYQERLYFDGISIHYGGSESRKLNNSVLVEMSGKGCRSFEKYGNSDFESIFKLILQHYSDDAEQRRMNCTRIDLAFDDFTGVLDLNHLVVETQKNNFVSRFQDWQCITGNKGLSVCHGSNKSNVYIRFYDKRLEQKMQDEIFHWVRAEIQIRKECAIGVIEMLQNVSVQECYYQVINNYIRYIVPDYTETNLRKCPTAPYWLKFLQSAERHSIFHKPADSYNFSNLHSYVTDHLSGAIQTVLDCIGTDQFLEDIKKSRKGKKLNPKYETVKREYQDECSEHGQNILDVLASIGA